MKGRILKSIVLVLLIAALFFVSAYTFLANAGARDALNLEKLPFRSYATVFAFSYLPGGLFECEIRLDPAVFDDLLSGRDFQQSDIWAGEKFEANRIPFYQPFEIHEKWMWRVEHSDGFVAQCTVFVNEHRTKAFVEHITD